MNRLLLTFSLFAIGLHSAIPAMTAEKLFAQATETDSQLKKLFDKASDGCRHSLSHDVRVAVDCVSMRIYGVALNERDWCYGRSYEANAQMNWHRCDANSIRFSLDKLIDVRR